MGLALPAEHLLHEQGEPHGPPEGRPLAGLHDGARDLPGAALAALEVEEVREVALVPAIDDVGGGPLALRVHAHVERPVELEREASLRAVQLQRADAEIHEQPSEGLDPQLAQQGWKVGDAGPREAGPISEGLEALPGELQDLGVLVRAKHGGAREALEQLRRVPPGTQRPIHDQARVPVGFNATPQQLHHLRDHHRDVHVFLAHRSPPGVERRLQRAHAPPPSSGSTPSSRRACSARASLSRSSATSARARSSSCSASCCSVRMRRSRSRRACSSS